LQSGDRQGLTTYLIDKVDDIAAAFAQTIDLFPVNEISVIAGRAGQDGPISAIHPGAIDAELNRRLTDFLGAKSANNSTPAAP
jgi:hypothetical protein